MYYYTIQLTAAMMSLHVIVVSVSLYHFFVMDSMTVQILVMRHHVVCFMYDSTIIVFNLHGRECINPHMQEAVSDVIK